MKGNLLRNCVLFGRLLRSLGIAVTPTQVVDLAESLNHIDIGIKQDFKYSAQAVLVHRQDHLAIFDAAFELFWQARNESDFLTLNLGSLLQNQQQPKSDEQQQLANSQDGEGENEEVPDDEMEIERVLTYSAREVLRQKDFAQLDESELAALQQLMLNTQWNLEKRRTRRTVRDAHGPRIDLRNTFRQNLRYGGETLDLARRTRKRKRRPLVMLCDISGSMERYSRVLLQFIYAITSDLDKVESFVFSTRLTRITRQLQKRNVDDALAEATHAVHDWAGGTRIGDAIKSFNYDWGRRVLNQGAIVLIISDGWDRGDIDLLGHEMDRLHRSCYRLIWLNPLLGSTNYEPLVRGIQAALPHIDDFLPVHNLSSLEQLAEKLVIWES